MIKGSVLLSTTKGGRGKRGVEAASRDHVKEGLAL